MALALGGAVLGGCVNDAASYLIDGRDHALTLLRQQPYFWSKQTELNFVVARFPDCQRRHSLKPAEDGDTHASLMETGPGTYLLQRGHDWYALDTKSCGLQPVSAPAKTGYRNVGAFDPSSGKLRFVASAAPSR
jgi:hypothetical protein